jgi:hypothetical protein
MLPGLEKLPDDLVTLAAQEFLQNIPALVIRLRMRMPEMAWSLNLSSNSLNLLSGLLNEGIAPVAGDQIVAGVNKSLIVEITAYLGSVVVRNLFGEWHTPAAGESELFLTYRYRGGQKIAYPFSDVVEMMLQGEFDLTRWYQALSE